MKPFFLFCFSFFVFFHTSYGQKKTISGKVIDSQTKEPLAFVTVAGEDKTAGTLTDIDGKFVFTGNDSRIYFSYVGYEPYTLTLTDLPQGEIIIPLKRKSFELKEVIIAAGENPAHRIIRQVTANRDRNNPEKMQSFSYTSYNKMIFVPKMDSALLTNEAKVNSLDTSDKAVVNFTKKQHLFLMESVSERIFKHPDRSYEKVVASRVSGLKDPAFTLLATQMQSFSFYNDYITIYDKRYLNPVSGGSTNKYSFNIEDTTYAGIDTIFIISYKPFKDKNFDGMKGLLYINTNGYALQNVIAEPSRNAPVNNTPPSSSKGNQIAIYSSSLENNIEVKIQQQYELIDGKQWFPTQLNTDILYNIININNFKIMGVGRSYLKDIKLNPELKSKEFGPVAIDIAPDAGEKGEAFWNQYRQDSLTHQDKTTYQVIDSIGKAENLDTKLKFAEALLSGKWPYKFLDIDLNTILNYNEYEGFRLGLGAHTNQKVSKLFSVGGYFAYGFRDKAFKYGGDAVFNIYRKRELQVGVSYKQDVIESGGINFYNDRKPLLNEAYRTYLISRMDSIEKKEAWLGFRALKYAKFTFGINQQTRTVTNDYLFSKNSSETITYDRFNIAEAVVSIKYSFREKFLKTPRGMYSMGSDYPVIWLQATKGLDNNLGGTLDYTRFDVKIEKSFFIKNLGKPSIQLLGGYIDENLPNTLLYSGRGSFKQFGLSVANTFETMGINEFLSNRYGAVFFSHNFGNLLIKTKRFAPELILVSNAGWGKLNNPQSHLNIPFKTMEKGYYESGLLVNNLTKVAFLGIGVGAFYRYGPYSHSDLKNNIAVKFSVAIAF